MLKSQAYIYVLLVVFFKRESLRLESGRFFVIYFSHVFDYSRTPYCNKTREGKTTRNVRVVSRFLICDCCSTSQTTDVRPLPAPTKNIIFIGKIPSVKTNLYENNYSNRILILLSKRSVWISYHVLAREKRVIKRTICLKKRLIYVGIVCTARLCNGRKYRF